MDEVSIDMDFLPRVSVSLSDVKDLAYKLVNEIEESDKKIIYLKNVQRQLRVSKNKLLRISAIFFRLDPTSLL